MNRRALLIGIILLVGAFLIYRSFQPPERHASGAAMANVVIPQLSAQAQEGETLFNRSCASCHGKNAAGQDGIAPPLVHKIYEPGHHATSRFFWPRKMASALIIGNLVTCRLSTRLPTSNSTQSSSMSANFNAPTG